MDPDVENIAERVFGAAVDGGAFVGGFGVGIAKGGWAIVTDVAALPGAVVDGVRWVGENVHGYALSTAVRWYYGDDGRQTEQQFGDTALDFLSGENLLKLADQFEQMVSADREVRRQVFFDLLAGDLDAAWENAGHYRLAFQFAAELIDAVAEELGEKTAYERGLIAGRIAFEIVSSFNPAGGLLKVTKASKLGFLTQLQASPLAASTGAAGRVFSTALTKTITRINALPSVSPQASAWLLLARSKADEVGGGPREMDLLLQVMREMENNSVKAHRELDAGLSQAALDLARVDFRRAASSPGGVELSKVHTHGEFNAEMKDQIQARFSQAGVFNHHVVPKYVMTLLGIDKAVHGASAPALLLARELHYRDGEFPRSFHSILNRKDLLPEFGRTDDGRFATELPPGEVRRRLKRAYREWVDANELSSDFGEDIIRVSDKWIDAKLSELGGGSA